MEKILKLTRQISTIMETLKELSSLERYDRGENVFSVNILTSSIGEPDVRVHVQKPLYERIKETTEGCEETVYVDDEGDTHKYLLCKSVGITFTCVVFKNEHM